MAVEADFVPAAWPLSESLRFFHESCETTSLPLSWPRLFLPLITRLTETPFDVLGWLSSMESLEAPP